MTQRAYAAALLFASRTRVHNAGTSADELAALNIIKSMGAKVDGNCITAPQNREMWSSIDAGESGLSARLFAPIAGLAGRPVTLTGHGSLLNRRMEGLAEVLPGLGISIENFNGYLPATICGPIKAVDTELYTSGSSQLVSGILYALCASATQPVTLTVKGLKSKPYIDMTLDVLAHFGRPVLNEGYTKFTIDPAKFEYRDEREITIEGDWSAASCLLVAGAIAGRVHIPNLRPDSRQADSILPAILEDAGAIVTTDGQGITVSKGELREFETDVTDAPDLFPALAALAAFCRGGSSIKGLHRLFDKESNRVESITEMLWRYGIPFSAEDDVLYIEGRERARYTYIDGYHDHRIVMAAAVCALRARGNVTITHAQAVNKSYPQFFEHLYACGVNCEVSE